jgi:hypothetical protein
LVGWAALLVRKRQNARRHTDRAAKRAAKRRAAAVVRRAAEARAEEEKAAAAMGKAALAEELSAPLLGTGAAAQSSFPRGGGAQLDARLRTYSPGPEPVAIPVALPVPAEPPFLSTTVCEPTRPVSTAAGDLDARVRTYSPPGPAEPAVFLSTTVCEPTRSVSMAAGDRATRADIGLLPPSSVRQRLSERHSITALAEWTPGARVELTRAMLEAATGGFSPAQSIASGTFGTVFHGRMHIEGALRAVAVKRMKISALDAGSRFEDGQAAFEHEAAMLRRCRHANVLALYGAFFDEGGEAAGKRAAAASASRFRRSLPAPPTPCHCLVFEFMDGGSLHSRLRTVSWTTYAPGAQGLDAQLPALMWHERLGIASDVARGLEYLHVNCNPPIIHQDVKSENVLLRVAPGGRLVAKLGDFGSARLVPQLLTQGHKKTLHVVGTTAYMCVAACRARSSSTAAAAPAAVLHSSVLTLHHRLARLPPALPVLPGATRASQPATTQADGIHHPRAS